MIRWLS